MKIVFDAMPDTVRDKFCGGEKELRAKMFIDENGKIRLIEIGARMGGDCIGTDLVRYSTGIDFVRAVIDVAGHPIEISRG